MRKKHNMEVEKKYTATWYRQGLLNTKLNWERDYERAPTNAERLSTYLECVSMVSFPSQSYNHEISHVYKLVLE